MLNRINLQYIITPVKRSFLWNVGFVLFARLKNHTIVFSKVRKVKTVMPNNVKFVGLPREENIIKTTLKPVLKNMNDGLNEIQKKFLKIKGLIITGIKKRSWLSSKRQEKRMDMPILKHIGKETGIKLIVTTLSLLLLNLVKSLSQINVKNVKTIVRHMLTTTIMQSLWMLFGFAENVMEKSIEYVYQRERLNLWTPKGDAIVQTTEETCRERVEAPAPPRNWSVSKLLLKVIEWLRHTAGCSFYQGQCITNDLWIQNLRSTGI